MKSLWREPIAYVSRARQVPVGRDSGLEDANAGRSSAFECRNEHWTSPIGSQTFGRTQMLVEPVNDFSLKSGLK